MKYLKTYENNIDEPKIGDYVICKEKYFASGQPITTYKLCEFVSNNVGKFIRDRRVTQFKYLIEYENVPKELKVSFNDDNMKNCRRMERSEILYWSESKEDCETFLAAKKYNL